MKKTLLYTLMFVSTCLQASACKRVDATGHKTSIDSLTNVKNMKLNIIVGDKIIVATMIDNVTTRAFVEMLPLTLEMTELHKNEKYGHLSKKLPGKALTPGTIHAGDIMLWDADYKCLVLFYKTFSSPYSYVKLGTVDNPKELEAALGSGDIQVRFEQLKSE
ncbi:cyclophilin-like fold protein [uncultured Sphingobacterium sp.]|uniref:cyclophilin-like fold protein n=1 Tax=uncultured Sphingobacterium sp. TaxID=182688 RepID=UPI003748C08E